MHFREVMKAKYPKTCARAAAGSRAAAMKLQCLECVGGSIQDVYDCADRGCWLHPFRPASRVALRVSKNDTQSPNNQAVAAATTNARGSR